VNKSWQQGFGILAGIGVTLLGVPVYLIQRAARRGGSHPE
jgi:hypothetical protein